MKMKSRLEKLVSTVGLSLFLAFSTFSPKLIYGAEINEFTIKGSVVPESTEKRPENIESILEERIRHGFFKRFNFNSNNGNVSINSQFSPVSYLPIGLGYSSCEDFDEFQLNLLFDQNNIYFLAGTGFDSKEFNLKKGYLAVGTSTLPLDISLIGSYNSDLVESENFVKYDLVFSRQGIGNISNLYLGFRQIKWLEKETIIGYGNLKNSRSSLIEQNDSFTGSGIFPMGVLDGNGIYLKTIDKFGLETIQILGIKHKIDFDKFWLEPGVTKVLSRNSETSGITPFYTLNVGFKDLPNLRSYLNSDGEKFHEFGINFHFDF